MAARGKAGQVRGRPDGQDQEIFDLRLYLAWSTARLRKQVEAREMDRLETSSGSSD